MLPSDRRVLWRSAAVRLLCGVLALPQQFGGEEKDTAEMPCVVEMMVRP